MIIEDINKIVNFEELAIGDVFWYGGQYYLKIPLCTSAGYNYDAYDLSNDDYNYFSDTREVTTVTAKLVIE